MMVAFMEIKQLAGSLYLSFLYDAACSQADFRTISFIASACYRNERELFSDFVDLGGEG